MEAYGHKPGVQARALGILDKFFWLIARDNKPMTLELLLLPLKKHPRDCLIQRLGCNVLQKAVGYLRNRPSVPFQEGAIVLHDTAAVTQSILDCQLSESTCAVGSLFSVHVDRECGVKIIQASRTRTIAGTGQVLCKTVAANIAQSKILTMKSEQAGKSFPW